MLKTLLTELSDGDVAHLPSSAETTLLALLESPRERPCVAVRKPRRVLSLIDPEDLPMAQKSYRPYDFGYSFLRSILKAYLV